MAVEIGKGRLETKIVTGPDDELGDLAVCFSDMSKSLSQSTTSINNLEKEMAMRKRAEKEQKALQAQLYHSQRMESIGTIANGIAHNFNNILN